MPVTTIDLQSLYRLLHKHFDDRHWWPGETPFEVVTGAVLVQNTAWANVQKAINNLKRVKALDPHVLINFPPPKIEELIRPCGYFRVKTVRLMSVTKWWLDNCDDDIQRFEGSSTAELRTALLEINGVGAETADSILLYAIGRPVFVIDAYTRRIMTRLGYTPDDITYNDLQAFFQKRLTPELALYNDFHAQFVALGHNHCRPTPDCTDCPLNFLCQYARSLNQDEPSSLELGEPSDE